MKRIIIDFEFTGLDNTYKTDNEIVQMKFVGADIDSDVSYIQNFATTKKSDVGAFLKHGIEHITDGEKFSADIFVSAIKEHCAVNSFDEIFLMGFSTSQDIKMLEKYGITRLDIYDIQERLRLTPIEIEMATQGSSLECCYYMVTGKIPSFKNHGGMEEMFAIMEIWQKTKDIIETKSFLKYMPYGHCAGMPIADYVENFRRAADGYRFNNNDALADAMNAYVEAQSLDDEFEDNFGCDDD